MKSDTKPRSLSEKGSTAVPAVALDERADAVLAQPGSETNAAAPPKPVSARKAKTYAPLADPVLEEMVRKADEDRWLASRFAPKALRQQLIALYAFNIEV